MYHNKENHKNNISECKQSRSGTCWFGDEKCWFNHTSNDENSEKINDKELSENQEIIDKIFSMMENFTKRIMKIEEKMQKTLIMEIENENGKSEQKMEMDNEMQI